MSLMPKKVHPRRVWNVYSKLAEDGGIEHSSVGTLTNFDDLASEHGGNSVEFSLTFAVPTVAVQVDFKSPLCLVGLATCYCEDHDVPPISLLFNYIRK